MKFLWLVLCLAPLFSACAPSPAETAVEMDQALEEESAFAADIKSPEARKAFDLVNRERVLRGLGPLQFDLFCQKAAEEHTENMFKRGFFSHDSPSETARQRFARWNLLEHTVGENIAETGSPEATVRAWMKSPGHRKNILSKQFHSAGMAYQGRYYTQCFSGRIPKH
jgi:uncharacterized protein YkwD